MNRKRLAEIARRLMRPPTAPWFEHGVRAEVEKICSENRLNWKRDAFGNVFVRLNGAKASTRPLVLAAHMDHPGFEVLANTGISRDWKLRFNGGVPDSWFKVGLPVRLMPGNVPAKLGKRTGTEKVFGIRTRGTIPTRPTFAVWDLEPFSLRNGRIHGRACDDLIGVATILAVMSELELRRANVNVIGLISRAEEVGFRGALAAIGTRDLPRNGLVISLETSRELPGVKMGQGVILRVGDKTSVFDNEAMRFLSEICSEEQGRDRGFRFQRGLMSGGTCEATAFQEFGFQTGAVCIALGNYHNCAANNKIAAEYVDLNDAAGMADLLMAAARAMSRFKQLVSKLPERLRRMRQEAVARLRRTAAPGP